MKLATPFFLSIVATACSTTETRTSWSPSGTGALPLELPPPSSAPPVTRAAAQDPEPEPTRSRIMLLFGVRFLDEDDFEPLEDQPTFGVDYSYEPPGSAVGFEVGIQGSYDEDEILGLDVEAQTGELYGGVRKTFGEPGASIRPFVGAGLSVITVEIEVDGLGEDDDSSVAGYAHGGFFGQVTPSFFIGADARLLFGSDIEIAGVDGDADYGQLALVLGWSF